MTILMRSIGVAFVLSFCVAATAATNGVKTFMPPNNLYLFDNPNQPGNITEAQFNQIVDSVVAVFVPIAKAHGANLTANKNWQDSTVNAFAQQSGNNWNVNFFGGLARRPEITPDGFALVVCHELGHHFGGYYFYDDQNWAAAEGEADYFATDVCARRIFTNTQNNLRFMTNQAPDPVKEKCTQAWQGKTPQVAQCARIAAGSLGLARLLAAVGGNKVEPKFETPDPTKVAKTNVEHPQAQCRLDTYFAGSLCTANWDPAVIPGKGAPGGNNSAAAEQVALKVSCPANAPLGARPACWFKQ